MATSPPPGMEDLPPQGLRIYPGDVISLRLTSAEVTEMPSLAVDDRGVVRIPLAGDIDVAGIPIGEAEQRLEEALQRYDRAVRVSVTISEPSGHMVSVIGAVGSPGRVALVPGMRIADVVAAAGGPSLGEEEAPPELAAATIVRDGHPLPISLPLALAGDPRHNVRALPGDSIYIPFSPGRRIAVIGQVGSPAIVEYWDGIRLTQALAIAGGVSRDGNWGDVRVLRGDAESPSVYRTSVADLVDGHTHDVVLAPGDVVYVASAGHADLRDVMASVSFLLSLPVTAASITVPALIIGR